MTDNEPPCTCDECEDNYEAAAEERWGLQPMNEKWKGPWLEALRSGEYAQGKHQLKRHGKLGGPDAYCCLGVLCEVMTAGGVLESRASVGGPFDSGFKAPGDTYFSDVMPSDRIDLLAGLDSRTGSELADMNDSRGKTFAEIADWIEENL